MSKAEERALEKYPQKVEWVGNQWDGAPFDVNSESRVAYKQGYNQAEKDNELTWEDIPKIFQISEGLKISWWFRDNEQTKQIGKQPFWEEVLRRFNEERNKV